MNKIEQTKDIKKMNKFKVMKKIEEMNEKWLRMNKPSKEIEQI